MTAKADRGLHLVAMDGKMDGRMDRRMSVIFLCSLLSQEQTWDDQTFGPLL